MRKSGDRSLELSVGYLLYEVWRGIEVITMGISPYRTDAPCAVVTGTSWVSREGSGRDTADIEAPTHLPRFSRFAQLHAGIPSV